MEVRGEQACKVGTSVRRVSGRLPDRERGLVSLAAIHTECYRTSLGGDVCRWRCIALYRRIRRPGIDSHRIGRLLSAQEIPEAIVFCNLRFMELLLDVITAGPGRCEM